MRKLATSITFTCSFGRSSGLLTPSGRASTASIIHVIFEMRIRQNRENDMADWVRGEGIRRKR